MAQVQLPGPVWLGLIFYESQCQGKARFVLTLVTKAVWCEVVSTHIQTNRKHSHCLFCCSVARTEYSHMLIFTTNNRVICASSSERWRCERLLAYRWTHPTSPRGWTPPSRISPINAQRRPAYEHLSFRYVTTRAESESFVFLILGVCRLWEVQFIYVETREKVFFIIWDL